MSGESNKRGGARPGSGRKKRETPPATIDARGVEGQNRAAALVNQLNEIDPDLMAAIALHVSDETIKIPKDATDELRADLEKQEERRRILLKVKRDALKRFRRLSFEVQGWARLWFEFTRSLDTRKYLYDKADGKAVQTINHLHDKPIEHNHTLNLGEGMKIAMQKAEERVRGRAS